MELVVTTQEDLKSIVSDAVKQAVKALQPKEPEQPKPPLMNVPEAVKFINDLGLKMGKSQFYKYTMRKEINAVTFGKKLLFKKADLEQWAESKIVVPANNHSFVVDQLAKSANKKRR